MIEWMNEWNEWKKEERKERSMKQLEGIKWMVGWMNKMKEDAFNISIPT